MPIKDLSERRRLPRLGRIKLGVMVQEPGKKPHPRSTEYFVVPDLVAQALGDDTPKALPIMFPADSPEVIFQQHYKMYRAAGAWCIGDGERARRWNDQGALVEVPCPCPFLDSGECGPQATLAFFLPSVPGIGVWTITTGNKTSIIDLNSSLELFSRLFGGLRGIPFTLCLEPRQSERFDATRGGMVKTTLYCLRLTTDKTLLEVIDWRRAIGAAVEPLMLPPVEEERPEDETSTAPHGQEAPPVEGAAAPVPSAGVATEPAATHPVPAGDAEAPWDISMSYSAAATLGVPPESYTRYLALKYAHVKYVPDDLPDAALAEQERMLRRAISEEGYAAKVLTHIRRVGVAKKEATQ